MTEEEKFWKGMQELRKEIRELKEQSRETDRRMRETDRRMKETDRRIGKLTDSWGRFVEGIVSPSAYKIFSKMGYKVKTTFHRVEVRRNNRTFIEYDTLLSAEKDGKNVLFVGEVKTHFTSQDVIEFTNDLLKTKKYLKEYKDYEVIGFVAGINYGEGVDTFAIKNGLYVLKPSGETMVLDVPKGFSPKMWG